ncbi:MAG: hypothetical protein ABS95_01765 [Verrucomicrobia bacterium SCN 57-15]|nr:MAG: hypothetical protein ABS95_01765 [Verrucomicrobia bacterium SCN 57-15]
MKIRAGQQEFERGVMRHRIAGLLARRQYGKTTLAARIALRKMLMKAGHTVIFGSVKIDLGREIVRKEAEALQTVIRNFASKDAAMLQLTDDHGKALPKVISADDFAELYEAQRLEFRLYHSKSVYSRTKVVALTPAAVGETGDLILDEVGRVKNFREVWEAVKPIIASQPQFRCVLTTTPPPDDAHYSFELLAPPLEAKFPVSPTGNWYRSELGVHVLRIDAWDAYADGVTLFDDDTGAPISPDDARAREHDKDAWDRNYGVRFVLGGTAAVGLIPLDSAQRRGIGQCACIVIQDELDFDRALSFLREKLGSSPVGIGVDLATTEKEHSNPTAATVMERIGNDYVGRVTFVWKTRDPALAVERLRKIVEVTNARPEGGRARRMAIDATSERYFAVQLQREFAPLVPVELVISSETVETPGGEKMTKKQMLGAKWVSVIDDNRAILPPERYLREDFRRVRKDRGTFACEIGPGGEHGDTFDSHKLAMHAIESVGDGAFTSETAAQVVYQNQGRMKAAQYQLPNERSYRI